MPSGCATPTIPGRRRARQREAFYRADPRRVGRTGRPRGAGAERGRRSGVPGVVEHLPAHGREPRRRARADADERRDRHPRTSCRSIRVPTLVLHRRHDRCLNVEEGRYVASRIPGARFVELPGDDHLPFVGDQDAMLDEIERFIIEAPPCWRRSIACSPRSCTRAWTAIAAAAHFSTMPRGSASGSAAAPSKPRRPVRRRFRRPGACDPLRRRARRRRPAASASACRVGLHTGECTVEDGVADRSAVDLASRIARRRRPARSSCRGPFATSSAMQACRSKIAACTRFQGWGVALVQGLRAASPFLE